MNKKQVRKIHEVRLETKKIRALIFLQRSTLKADNRRKIIRKVKKMASKLRFVREYSVYKNLLLNLISQTTNSQSIFILKYSLINLQVPSKVTAKKIATYKKDLKKIENKIRQDMKVYQPHKVKQQYIENLDQWLHLCYFCLVSPYDHRNFHEFRKLSKKIYYQISTLKKTFPEDYNLLHENIKRINKILGDAHDLVELSDKIKTPSTELIENTNKLKLSMQKKAKFMNYIAVKQCLLIGK